MSNSTTTPSAAGINRGSIHKSLKIPRFKPGASHPSTWSAQDMNLFAAALESLLNPSVVIDEAVEDATGNFTPTGKYEISDQNTILHLSLSPGQAQPGGTVNVILGRVTAEASEYVTVQPIQATGDGTYSDTGGSTFNVAKPFKLRGLTGTQIFPQYTDATFFRIYAVQSPSGGTGVYVSGSDVGYEDANVDARVRPPYQGTYNSATDYQFGDIVRVQTGGSQGIWICVIGHPTSGHQPTFPEPATTGGTNYWEMWAFGILSIPLCSGGTNFYNANT